MLRPSVRLLGVDPGQSRIGLALSDEADGSIALPYQTVDRKKMNDEEAAIRVRDELVDTCIQKVIVGLPLRLDGSEGEAARRARRFGKALHLVLQADVEYVDERLTSVLAERSLGEIGIRGKRRRRVVDQTAAALILQTYIDREAAREHRMLEEAWEGADEENENR